MRQWTKPLTARSAGSGGGERLSPLCQLMIEGLTIQRLGRMTQLATKCAVTNCPPDIAQDQGSLHGYGSGRLLEHGHLSRPSPSKLGPGCFATRQFDRKQHGRRLHMIPLSGGSLGPKGRPVLQLHSKMIQACCRHTCCSTWS